MLSLLLMVALLVVAAAAVLPSISFEIRRDREQELIHRGVQYSRAIRSYYKKFGRYPTRIEELESSNNLRFLRKRYKDPITGQDFKLLHFGEVKMAFNAPLAGASNLNGTASINNPAGFGSQPQPGGVPAGGSFGGPRSGGVGSGPGPDGAEVGALVDGGDRHQLACLWGMHHPAGAYVHAHVAEAFPEDEIARLELVAIDPASRPVLRGCRVRQHDAGGAVGELREAGAVERTGAEGAVAIGPAELLQGSLDRSGGGGQWRWGGRGWGGGRSDPYRGSGGRGRRRGGRGRRCNGDGGDERHHVRLHGVRGLGGECSDRPRRRWDHRTWRMRGRRRHDAQQTVSQKREARARQASPPHRELAPFGRDPGNFKLQTGRS